MKSQNAKTVMMPRPATANSFQLPIPKKKNASINLITSSSIFFYMASPKRVATSDSIRRP